MRWQPCAHLAGLLLVLATAAACGAPTQSQPADVNDAVPNAPVAPVVSEPIVEPTPEPTAETLPIANISRADAACILDLAAAVGIGPIDRVVEPKEILPPGDDYCLVFERAESPALDVTRYRVLEIVREQNEHAGWVEPDSWSARCGWKTSPTLIQEYELHRFVIGNVEVEIQLFGKDPVSHEEAKRILEALAQTAPAVLGDIAADELPERMTGIKHPPRIFHEVFPDIIPHEQPGHTPVEVYFETGPRLGRIVVVCRENEHVTVVGERTWKSYPSNHRCPW